MNLEDDVFMEEVENYVSNEEQGDESGSNSASTHMVNCASEFTTNKLFKSREELIRWAREVGKVNGFVIVTLRSDQGGKDNRSPRLTLGCERSGQYVSRIHKKNKKDEYKKNSGTKKCGCPFQLKGTKLATDDDWILTVVVGVHNHTATDHLEGHSFAGRLSSEETSLVIDLSKSSVQPKEILTTLKQRDKQNASTLTTIYNARQRLRLVEKGERSQMQQLMSKLSEHRYTEWHRSCSKTNTILDLFWTHPTCVELLRAFPHILIMDCTYKTDRYCMPLLEIVGVTSTDITFSVGFVYLSEEREDNYVWALSILRELMDGIVMPDVIVTGRKMALMRAIEHIFGTSKHLLCRWHVNKNVLAKFKKLCKSKEDCDRFSEKWNTMVTSSTKDDYIRQTKQLCNEFSMYQEMLQYVKDTWLNPYKERFVAAWIDKFMHFGNTTSNRAESSHAKLKRQLGSSQRTFEKSWESIHALLGLQHTEIKASFAKSLIDHDFRHSDFRELCGFVSISALHMVLKEYKLSKMNGIDPGACGCVLRDTHGLPCAHEIVRYMRDGRPIPLESINPHWRKLDMKCTPIRNTAEYTYDAELKLFHRRWIESDTIGKMVLKRKLMELGSAQTTSLVEPFVTTKTRGRPSKKTDKSTRHDSSEIVESEQGSYSLGMDSCTLGGLYPEMSSKQKRRPKEKEHLSSSVKPIKLTNAFPVALWPYILDVEDVKADGHCGFRVVASLLGYTEDGWVQVRKDLLKELETHSSCYSELYGSENRVHELKHALGYFETPVNIDRWMTMPDMGHIIASRYGVVLIHLSNVQYFTFLPLRTTHVPLTELKEIAIGFINYHFVKVFLKSGDPIPPIAPGWKRYCKPECSKWDTSYFARIQQFKSIIGSTAITREIVELDKN